MDLLEQVTEKFNTELRSNMLDIIKRHNIPCDFGEHNPEMCMTIFATNTEILKSSRRMSKYQLMHPKLDIAFAAGYNFNFSELINLPHSRAFEKPIKLCLIWNSLLKEEWTSVVIRTITS